MLRPTAALWIISMDVCSTDNLEKIMEDERLYYYNKRTHQLLEGPDTLAKEDRISNN